MPLLDLPNELILAIARSLSSEGDINALSQTNSLLYALLNSYLYSYHVHQNPTPSDCPALLWAAKHAHLPTATRLIHAGANPNSEGQWHEGPVIVVAARAESLPIVELLLAHKADPDGRDGPGWTALMYAADGGDEDMVRLLVRSGADVGLCDESGFSAAAWAASYGEIGMLEILLGTGQVGMEERGGSEGETLLLRAVERAGAGMVRFLLDRGARVDVQCADGEGVLSRAARGGRSGVLGGNIGVFRLLLERGADPMQLDRDGRGPVWHVAEEGSNAMFRLLVEKGADLGRRDAYGMTLLAAAAQWGRLSIMRVLLAKGADINEQQRGSGWTAVESAAAKDQGRAITFLLRKGAHPDIRGPNRWSALAMAANGGHLAAATALLKHARHRGDADFVDRAVDGFTPLYFAVQRDYSDMVRLLLRFGASLDYRGPGGRTHLSNAVQLGNDEVAKIILEKGADIETRDADGLTPLAHAARYGSQEILEMLLTRGAKIEIADNEGRTPLGHAAGRGSLHVAETLLKHGALIDARDKKGQTPLSHAMGGPVPSFFQMMRLLLENGADANAEDHDGRTPLSRAEDDSQYAADTMRKMMDSIAAPPSDLAHMSFTNHSTDSLSSSSTTGYSMDLLWREGLYSY